MAKITSLLDADDRWALNLSTLWGVGYTPLMPGTASCLVAVFAFVILKSSFLFFTLTVVAIILAFKYCGRAEEILKEKDSKYIVIDDFSGMLLTYLFIPADIRFIICGFFLFRMMDMLKVPPAHRIEKLPGAKGIVGDDLIAGVYANLLLHFARLFI